VVLGLLQPRPDCSRASSDLYWQHHTALASQQWPGIQAVSAWRKLGCRGVAGNKSYAAAVTKLLDPSGELFGQRVIAQGADRVEEMQADQAKSFMQVRMPSCMGAHAPSLPLRTVSGGASNGLKAEGAAPPG
jgi:hypothetical protein